MKAAFHFETEHAGLSGLYGEDIVRTFARAVRRPSPLRVQATVFLGGLLFYELAGVRRRAGRTEVVTVDPGRYAQVLDAWLDSKPNQLTRLRSDARDVAIQQGVFVLYLNSVGTKTVLAIDTRLRDTPWYVGALEVAGTNPVHRALYGCLLIPSFRLAGSKVYLFWDGVTEESKVSVYLDGLRDAGLTADYEERFPLL